MRPSIYIGLGGTGIRAIAQTKKLYEDVYGVGNVPKCIAFLAIDFNLKDIEDSSLATSIRDDAVIIQYNGSPRKHYEERQAMGDYKWMFPGNTRSIADKITDGAGQVRTTGRLYTEYIMAQIEPALEQVWLQVANLTYSGDDGYAVKCEEIDIHIAMSLAGGTGAGSFINISELISRRYGERAHIIGYGVLHGVFKAMDTKGTKTKRVAANAYSAILDLDYLMSADIHNPISLKINGEHRTLKQPLFNEFFVIDNFTAKGHAVLDVGSLCEALGTCLFASSGDMGSTIQGGQSNNNWSQGGYDIMHKLGWVQGLGGCQVVYNGDLLAQIYGCKAAVELIRKMRQEGTDIQQVAIDWTMSAKVREDEGNDLLIDSIYSPEAMGKLKDPKVTIDDSDTDTKTEIERYTNTLVEFPDAKILSQLQAEKDRLLKEKLDAILAGDGGVGNALKFLSSLSSQIGICRAEMEAEILDRVKERDAKSLDVEKRYKEYEEYRHRFFKTDSGKQERLGTLIGAAKGKLRLAIEIKRREAARDIFIHLLDVIDNFKKKIKAIDEALNTLSDAYNIELETSVNKCSTSIFEYDLSLAERKSIRIDANDIGVAGFIATLDNSLLELDVNVVLKPAVDKFVASLPQAVAYRTKRLIDIINNLDEKSYNLLKDAIIAKSSRLLRVNNRGQQNDSGKPTDLMVNEYLISLFGSADEVNACRLNTDEAFKRNATAATGCQVVANSCEPLSQKMFVFRADYAIIPYCIDALNDTVAKEYETIVRNAQASESFNPHFDRVVFAQMVEKNFKLKPELQNEALFYWVCGQLFGYKEVTETGYVMVKDEKEDNITLKIDHKEEVTHRKYIRCIKGRYYFWANDKGSNGQLDKWYPIGGERTTADRLKAFEYFKSLVLPEYRCELHNYLLDVFHKLGQAQRQALVKDVCDMGKMDYIDLILCTDKSSATYYSQKKMESAQIDAEWDYIVNELGNAIENFK